MKAIIVFAAALIIQHGGYRAYKARRLFFRGMDYMGQPMVQRILWPILIALLATGAVILYNER